MILCLVTDRKRLAKAVHLFTPKLRRSEGGSDDLLIAQIAGAVAGGVDLIQLREDDLEAGALLRLARRIVREVPGAGERLIINDRFDVALAAGARGVHLKESSIDTSTVRRLAPAPFVIGRSVHGPEQLVAHRCADYLIAGTVLSTPSKPGGRLLGLEGLKAVVQEAGEQPVLAIGGLSHSVARPVAATGAAGIAAVGLFIPDRVSEPGQFVKNQAEKLRKLFDSAVGVP
jgi:thiamine-phosphate pyrophosphorylase